jgi:flagellar motor switch protein FliN/FliY
MPFDATPSETTAAENPEAALLVANESGARAESEGAAADDPLAPDSALGALPLQLDVLIPVPRFRVEDLLSLEKGRVLETAWVNADDLPVWAGGVQLVWSEFEVVEQKLAVRVTRLV